MDTDRYTREKFIEALYNPSLFISEAGRLFNKNLIYPILEKKFEKKYGDGIDIIEQDWDTLIILDALRYDAIKKLNYPDGELNSVISRGSTSVDFIQANFGEKELYNTVYITANGWIESLEADPFFLTKKTYNDFNNRHAFYRPENIYNLATDTFTNYPNKRYIIHFMQPHMPYLGPKATDLREKLSRRHNIRFSHFEMMSNSQASGKNKEDIKNLMNAARNGYISARELWQVYIENIEVVMGFAEKLNDKLNGKTVITADHGELLGEKVVPLGDKIFGHPGEVATTPLRKVPWLELKFQQRREIQQDTPISSDLVPDHEVDKTLNALGYR